MKFPGNPLPKKMPVEWKEKLFDRPVVVGIIGPIGVGKSTFTSILSDRTGFIHFEERFAVNPFLEKFYLNPWEWSFKSQVWFLENKIAQLSEMKPDASYIIDPALAMDRLYAKTLTKIGRMSGAEFRTYDQLYKALIEARHVRTPDLYLWLDAKTPKLRERVIKRGREYELNMLREYPYYLAELRNEVRNFASSQKGQDVIYVNASRDNFADEIHMNGLIERIKRNI